MLALARMGRGDTYRRVEGEGRGFASVLALSRLLQRVGEHAEFLFAGTALAPDERDAS
jgi:hypothetical protein